jgi:hypothetical protein
VVRSQAPRAGCALLESIEFQNRLRTWFDRYRFAGRELEYTYGEAALYANVRSVEEQNRQRLVDRQTP